MSFFSLGINIYEGIEAYYVMQCIIVSCDVHMIASIPQVQCLKNICRQIAIPRILARARASFATMIYDESVITRLFDFVKQKVEEIDKVIYARACAVVLKLINSQVQFMRLVSKRFVSFIHLYRNVSKIANGKITLRFIPIESYS